jgi:hypothetical protein
MMVLPKYLGFNKLDQIYNHGTVLDLVVVRSVKRFMNTIDSHKAVRIPATSDNRRRPASWKAELLLAILVLIALWVNDRCPSSSERKTLSFQSGGEQGAWNEKSNFQESGAFEKAGSLNVTRHDAGTFGPHSGKVAVIR